MTPLDAHLLLFGLVVLLVALAGCVAAVKRAPTLSVGFFVLAVSSALHWYRTSYPFEHMSTGPIDNYVFLQEWFMPMNNVFLGLGWILVIVGVFKLPKPSPSNPSQG